MQVVVVDEGDASAVDGVDRVAINLLQMMLAGIVGRMRLARKDDLHVPAGRRQQANQPVGILEDQLRPLIRRETAGEADRQRARIEQRSCGDDSRRADVLLRPAIACALADEREQEPLERRAGVPQRFVRNLEHAVPELRVVLAVAPVGAEMLLEELGNLERQPRGRMDAVGDVGERPLPGLFALLEQGLPHLARDIGVESADAVREIRRPQRERGHVELSVMLAEREKAAPVVGERAPCPLQVMLDAVERKRIVTGGDGRVGCEDGGAPHGRQRLIEAHALGDVLVDALQDHECGVPFVQMPDSRRDSQRAQRPNAADAEDDFLLQARFAIAAIQARGEIAILRGVFLEPGVEQVQRHASD